MLQRFAHKLTLARCGQLHRTALLLKVYTAAVSARICMRYLRLFLALAVLACAGCLRLNKDFPSADCRGDVPAGFTRIFIGTPGSGGSQSGTSADDPLDGTSAEKFDAILRTIVEGKLPTWGAQQKIQPENLIVCIGSGTFATNGYSRLTPGDPSGDPGSTGFAVGKNWKIHGQGPNSTTLLLSSYVRRQFPASDGSVFNGGANVVISTYSSDASQVEISDLTIDANHDGLTSAGGLPLTLQAIALRSVKGGHWIHNVNVIGISGDAGFLNTANEAFAVQIWGEPSSTGGSESTDNLIENVTVTDPGTPVITGELPGGAIDGIVVNNAAAEIRKNMVKDISIGYGGWTLRGVSFHDNVAQNGAYGFNTDSFNNSDVMVQSNQIIHPALYGIVLGGSSTSQEFSRWTVANNTIVLQDSASIGIVLRGQVRDSTFSGNSITADRFVDNAKGFVSYASGTGVSNFNNAFQQNQIDKILRVDFSGDPNFSTDCRYLNRDLQGNPLPGFDDNSSQSCGTGTAGMRVVR